jgi:hypothetical protein
MCTSTNLVLSCCIFLSNCTYNPDYRIFDANVFLTKTGKGPSKEYLKEATKFYFDELANYTGKSRKKIKKTFERLTEIRFYDQPIPMPWVKQEEEVEIKAAGLMDVGSGEMKVWWKWDCISQNAYWHEIMHHSMYWYLERGNSGGSHKEHYWKFIKDIKIKYYNAGDKINCVEVNPFIPEDL